MTDPEYLTTQQAAVAAGVSEGLIARYCRDGKITARKHGERAWLIRPTDLDRWIDEGQHTPGRVPATRRTPGQEE